MRLKINPAKCNHEICVEGNNTQHSRVNDDALSKTGEDGKEILNREGG